MGYLFRLFGETAMKENENKPKIIVMHDSASQASYQLAMWAVKGAEKVGAEVKSVKALAPLSKEVVCSNSTSIPFSTEADLEWADAIILSVSSRDNRQSDVRSFFGAQSNLWLQNKLENKVVSVMSSEEKSHAVAENMILTLYKLLSQFGAIVATPGYTDIVGSNPYGTVTLTGEITKDVQSAAMYQAARTVKIAKALSHLKG